MTSSGEPVLSSRAPLRGLRVIDFGQMIAVPLLGQWLGRLGAEVILVESRANLPSRAFGPFANAPGPNTSSIFNYMNRNKRSCTLNLRTPRGVDLAKRLVSVGDIVQENFSPGRHGAPRTRLRGARLGQARRHPALAKRLRRDRPLEPVRRAPQRGDAA